MLPLAAAVAPFGAVIGATVASSGVPAVAGLATAPLVYSGSAQLATISLLSAGASVAAVLLTVLAVNARLALYGAALRPRLDDQPRWFRWAATALVVDPQYVVVEAGPGRSAPAADRRRYYLGAAAVLWVTWHLATVAGYAAGPLLPASWHLDVVVPLYLAAVVAPRLRTERVVLAAAVGAVTTVLLAGLPNGTGLLGGILAGLAVLVLWEEVAR